MKLINDISKGLSSLLLIAALLLPSGIQLIHAFDGHEHKACNDYNVHLHEATPNCELCQFHHGNFNYESPDYSLRDPIDPPNQIIKQKVEESESSTLFFKSLRAPPLLV